MPAIYAHYRFGQSVLALLSDSDKIMISKYKDLYNIGLHGPDILFYYRPFSGNPVNRAGNRAHTVSGRVFFSGMWEVVEQQDQIEPYLAYLYGFLCHYALDSACHGCINELSRTTAFSHSQLETELDRYFMIADGKDPMRFLPTGHIHPGRENARIIASFFPGIKAEEIYESLCTMVLIENLWIASNPVKRGLVTAALKISGQFDERRGLLREYDAPSSCVGLLPPVIEMYNHAVCRGARYITGFTQMAQGKTRWESDFDLPFDPQNMADAPTDS